MITALRLICACRYARHSRFRDGVSHVGYVFGPQMNLDLRWPSATAADRWNFGLLVEVPFSDRRLNEYFYGVPPADATATRPAYRCQRSGYGGWQALAALSHRKDRWWFGGFIKYDNVSGSVFADSPLVTQRRGSAAALRLAMCLPARRPWCRLEITEMADSQADG